MGMIIVCLLLAWLLLGMQYLYQVVFRQVSILG